MRSWIFSLIGALIGGCLCVVLAWGIGAMFGPLYDSEDEAIRNFKIFLGCFVVFILLGGVAGFRAGKKTNKRL